MVINNNKNDPAAQQKRDLELSVYQIELETQNAELRWAQEELENKHLELRLQNDELCRAREELELSRNKYSELFDFAPVGYFTFDPTGLIQEVNLTGAQLLGGYRVRLTNAPFSNWIDDADGREIFSGHLAKALQGNGIQKCELKIKGKDGAIIYGQLQSVRVDATESETGLILSSIVDGTLGKLQEFEIQEAREYAESIVETVHNPLVVLNSDLKILTANQSFYKTFKVTSEETIGHFIYDIGNRQWDIPELRALFADILPNDSVFNRYEVDLKFPRIGRKNILLSARQLFRKDIGSQKILLVMEDNTAHKQADEKLRLAAQYARSLIEASLDPLVTISVEGKITDVNEGSIKVTGVSRQKLIGTDFSDYFTEPERARAGYLEAFSKGAVTDYPLTIRHKDGHLTDVLYNATVYKDVQSNVLGVFAAARNVTESKRLAQALQENNIELEIAKSAAEKANHAKSDFLSSMSHELRTPLSAVLGFAQLIESGSPQPTPNQKRSVDQILKAGWYLLELINEILDLALIESGKLSLSLEPVCFAEIIQECSALIELQTKKHDISVTFTPLETRCFVRADRTRLKQVLFNLLSNAIKYNRPGGSVIVTSTLTGNNSIRISVLDTGKGLDKHQLKQLFQPFNRLGQEASGEQGTGIGLVVSKRLVEWMGGGLGVESTVGKGSEFWIELKLATVLKASDGTAEAPAPLLQRQDDDLVCTLLYVEDNPANMMLVEDIIARRADIRLLTARSGKVGIELARARLPDIILMDINLPGISGIDAMTILAVDKATAHIPVIALSANAMPRDIERGLEAGFFRYLTKPIKVNAFMNALDEALEYTKQTTIKEQP